MGNKIWVPTVCGVEAMSQLECQYVETARFNVLLDRTGKYMQVVRLRCPSFGSKYIERTLFDKMFKPKQEKKAKEKKKR